MYEKYLEQLSVECEIRNYTPRTAQAYRYNVERFLNTIGKPAEELNLDDARNYILDMKRSGIAAATCNACNSSLAFFYKYVLHIMWNIDYVPRMRKDYHYPEVLTLQEIELLIDTAKTIRNKALIALLYSSGLRVGELVNLAPSDIYKSTMQVHVRNTKNHSDRWTILSKRALDLITEYWLSSKKNRDRKILFISSKYPYQPLKVNAIERLVRMIGREAGIKKATYPHLLRHSFATHLLEQGVTIEYIQTLLGHRCADSTAVYLHVTNKTLMGIQSPLDLIPPKEEDDEDNAKDGGEKDV